MKRNWIAAFSVPPALFAALALLPSSRGVGEPPPVPDRSPTDLALSADGRRAVTANHTAHTASLVDLAGGKVVAETPTGKRPFAVALSRDGARALVTNTWSDSISVLAVSPTTLRVARTLQVGDEPRGVVFSRDETRAFVALGGEDAVAVVDLQTAKVARRIPVGTEPWHLALSPDGKRLAVGNARGQTVDVIDTAKNAVLHTVRMRGRNLRHLAVSPDGRWAYAPHISERGMPATRENIDNGWVVANRLGRVPLTEAGPREAIALDMRGKAVGDADGVALSPDGKMIAVTAGGTHELLLFRLPLPFIAYGGPGDHVEPELLGDPQRFRRVPLGGRPLGVRFAPDGKNVVVANYLANAVQVVDAASGKITRTIALGGPQTPSPARVGEAIFYDAERSFNQWFSCATCHVEGHTNGSSFDTFNDGRYGNPKKTLSLRGVTQTPPWTWHGWQGALRDSIHESLSKSMQGPEATEADRDALHAFFETLDFAPPTNRAPDGSLTPAAKRGEALFAERACIACHAPPHFTSRGVFTVGLESPEDAYKGFNPPPLRGVGRRDPYLHDGRAKTLEEVLGKYHRPSQLTGRPDFSERETADVIAFLRSL